MKRRLSLLLPLLLVASSHCGGSSRFREVSYDSSRLPRGNVEMKPGSYRIEMIATTGTRTGVVASGYLMLYQACASDRSPRTGEGPWLDPHSRALSNLWGYTDLDLASVGALVERERATSRDPIHPGVLGDLVGMEGLRRQVLYVGAASDRGRTLTHDGVGIVLRIEQVVGRESFGVWTHAGIAANGSGTWWASRVDDNTELTRACK